MSTLSDVLMTPQCKLDKYKREEIIMKASETIIAKLRKKPNSEALTLDIPEAFASGQGWKKGDELEVGTSPVGVFIRMGIGKCDLCGSRASTRLGDNRLCQCCIDKVAALKKTL